MAPRIRNFNPGPAALPESVLKKAQSEFLNFRGSGMSVTEISHRSKEFDAVHNEAIARVKRLLGLGDDFEVLFLQGGASLQFCMVPMNFSRPGQAVDYVNTGTWATKAIKEAKILGRRVNVLASSEDQNFSYIPRDFTVSPEAAYLHICSNNTIKGTQWAAYPDAGGKPLVADMSSDIFSRVFDPKPFGCFYAGAQKNMGPAGVALVVIRKDMLDKVPDGLPTMLDYRTHVGKNSLFNTPPCFAIYLAGLVLEWLEEEIGGVSAIEKINRRKSDLLYGYLDSTDFYRPTAAVDSRSRMNVTFRLPSEDLEAKFVAEAQGRGLGGLKGHRSVGGCRASIYNPTTLETVEELVAFMKKFEAKNG
jgi:phosphoserine aminotransferase